MGGVSDAVHQATDWAGDQIGDAGDWVRERIGMNTWDGAGPGPMGTSAPPAPPSLTDEVIDRARKLELARGRSRQGRRSTFLTGPLGAPGAPPSNRKTLLGS